MPFNGIGGFTLVAGNPVVTGTTISSTVHNNTNTDFANGFANCITRDGQSPATANVPMGGFKLTGLAAATTNGDAVRWEQAVLAADLASTVSGDGSGLVGFLQSGTGAVGRTVQSKLRDSVSVMDFGAVGDGTTDDTAAIQAAENTGKAVYFPDPSSFYRVTSAITMSANPLWFGERGVTTIIRRTSGAGGVLNFPAGNENGVIENLRIGGIGSTGIIVNGGGYANYLSTLSLRNVHFEADMLVNINANLIHCNFGSFLSIYLRYVDLPLMFLDSGVLRGLEKRCCLGLLV